jgi:D-glycero-beta-D-manno-heptose 1-phosphate adenylyltransferase
MTNFIKTNWRTEKILTLEEAEKKAAELKEQGSSTVTVNGAFDLLHAGHLDQLEEAKKQGDVLFVGINSDKSIQGYKGKDRPFITEQARAAILAALICVDYVVIIDSEAKEVQNYLLRAVKPGTHVNGAEYGKPEEWIEYPVMQEVGANGYTVEKINDFSTTDIIKKIRA